MKNLWHKRVRFCLLFFIVFIASFSLALAEDESEPGDIPVSTIDRGKSTRVRNAPQHQHPSPSLPSSHSRRRRQAFDGFRFSDLFRIFNSGPVNLENIETFSRAVQNDFVTPPPPPTTTTTSAPTEEILDAGDVPVEDPTLLGAQQQLQQAGFLQTPQFIQPGLQQIPGFVQPGLQYIPQGGIQQFVPQVPQFAYPQYIHPAATYLQPQYLPYHPALLHPSLSIQGNHAAQAAAPSNGHETHALPAVAHGTPAMGHHAGGGVQRSGEHVEEESHGTQREVIDDYQTPWQWVSNRNFFQGYRDRIQRRQEKRNWFARMFRNIKEEYYRRNGRNRRGKRDVSSNSKKSESLHRLKRSIVDTFKKMWRSSDFVGALDRMMEGTNDSLYPYTKAALMGYTGTHNKCEELYPHCPTSVEEVIHTFNNLNRFFPNGLPFRDRIPRPFRYLVP